MDKETYSVSYTALVLELARRLRDGWRSEDPPYFAELVNKLIANERNLDRVVTEQTDREIGKCSDISTA